MFLEDWMKLPKDYENHFLNIAIAYGGQNELVDAVKKIGMKIKNDGK